MRPGFLKLLWVMVVAISLVTPLVMSPYSLDVFRTPKDIVFMSMTLILVAVAAGGALLSDDLARLFLTKSPVVFVALAATLWTAIASIFSVRPYASLWKPLTVFCFAAYVIVLFVAARSRGFSALWVIMVPAVINTIIAAGQSTRLWMPWAVSSHIPDRLRTTGLIGNPNDLGSYLLLPALAAFAAAIAWPRWRRWMAALAVVLIIGIASAQSVTPVLAAMAGLFTMAMTSTTRRLRYAVLGAIVVLMSIAAIHPASRARFMRLYENASLRTLPEMTSFRVVPAVTAFRMFLDRPITGQGPGSFGSLYMNYRFETDEQFPQWIRPGSENFSQVHNDHMQVLAETGLPGYLIFLGALGILGAITFRRGDPRDERERFARTFALPAAAAFGTLALAMFPLQLTAPMIPALFLGTLCFAWTESDESA